MCDWAAGLRVQICQLCVLFMHHVWNEHTIRREEETGLPVPTQAYSSECVTQPSHGLVFFFVAASQKAEIMKGPDPLNRTTVRIS